ncbi:MAG: aldehyde dehydrogenase family protein [Colwellia sp.]
MQKDVLSEKIYKHFINGEWVESNSGELLQSINPANKQHLADFQRGNKDDIDRAVDAAQKAFDGPWLDTTFTDRAQYLFEIEKIIKENHKMLATIETLDNGKPFSETDNADIALVADHFQYFGSACRTFQETHIDLPGQHALNKSVPLGVVGMIIPWNFPLLMFAWKIAPALAAGNTIVIKPAEQTSLTALELMKKIAGVLPAGVLNIVTGVGSEAGDALASHKAIRKLAFTGSTAIGHMVALKAAQNGIPCTTELGGKSPVIVFPDADLDAAAAGAVSAITFNQGEVCSAGSRVLVEESIAEEFQQRMVEIMKNIKVGNPFDAENTMGAVVSKEQFDKIQKYISYANDTAELEVLCGNEPVSSEGFFVRPMLVLSNNDSKLAKEEIFGPVLSMITFKDEEEALAIANDTSYGLGAGLWTKDESLIARMTGKRGIQAGRIWVNQHHTYSAHTQFGGFKDSGIGRETSLEMLSAYTQNISVCIKR